MVLLDVLFAAVYARIRPFEMLAGALVLRLVKHAQPEAFGAGGRMRLGLIRTLCPLVRLPVVRVSVVCQQSIALLFLQKCR